MTVPERKLLAFVLYPGLTPLDLIGPLQALAPLPRVDPSFEVAVVAETPAATHWAYRDVLEHLGANPVRARWVEDGKYLTTAGVSAGIDGGLRLAQRLVGDDAAKLIQLGMQYEPEPPLGPIDWNPAVVEAVRPIWRGPLPELLEAHPHLARRLSNALSGHPGLLDRERQFV